MKRFTEIFSGIAALLFHTALTGWMFCLSEINFDFTTLELNYLQLGAALVLAYLLNRLMLGRGMPVPVFAVLQALFMALGVFVFINSALVLPYQLRTVVINCIVYALGFLIAAWLAWSPSGENGILLRFDAQAVMLVIMLLLSELLHLPGSEGALVMGFVSLAALLLASVSMKSGLLSHRGGAVQGDPAAGRIMLAVVLGSLASLAALVAAFAGGGVRSVSEFFLRCIKLCVGAVGAVLKYLYSLLERFVSWLAGLAGEQDTFAGAGANPVGGIEPDIAPVETVPVPSWIYPALIAIAVALAAFILFRLRRVRVGKIKLVSVAVPANIRRERGLKKALKGLWRRIAEAMAFRINCLRYRRTAPGLLVWCENHAPACCRRRAEESGESFLLRLADCGGGEEQAKALRGLAEMVQQSFYSPHPVKLPPEIYKTVRRASFKTDT